MLRPGLELSEKAGVCGLAHSIAYFIEFLLDIKELILERLHRCFDLIEPVLQVRGGKGTGAVARFRGIAARVAEVQDLRAARLYLEAPQQDRLVLGVDRAV